jgi:hypothetical protein
MHAQTYEVRASLHLRQHPEMMYSKIFLTKYATLINVTLFRMRKNNIEGAQNLYSSSSLMVINE